MAYQPPEYATPITLTVGYKTPGIYQPRVLSKDYQPPALGEPLRLAEIYQAPALADPQTLLTPYQTPAIGPLVLDTRYSAPESFEPVTLRTPYEPPRVGKSTVITEGYKAPNLSQPQALAEGYTTPALTARVSLADPYAPPGIGQPIVLTNGLEDPGGAPEPDAEGHLLVNLPSAIPAFSFAAFGAQDTTYNPPPLYSDVVLRLGYTMPPLDSPVEVSEEIEPDSSIYGNLTANLPALPPHGLTLTATAKAQPAGTMTANLPSAVRPLGLVASAEVIGTGYATALLPELQAHDVIAAGEFKQLLELPDNGISSRRTRHRSKYPKQVIGLEAKQQHGQPTALRADMHHQHGLDRRSRLETRQAEMIRFQRPIGQAHQHGLHRGWHTGLSHAEAVRTHSSTREAHQHGLDRQGHTGLQHADTLKRRASVRLAEQQAIPAAKGLSIGNREAWPAGTRLEIRWTKADHPAPGYWWPIYQPPALRVVMPFDDYQPPALRCPVLLGKDYPQQPDCPTEPEQPTITIPTRETYTVINTLTLTEPDGTPIAAEDFSASIDADSWTWSWSARIPAYALAQVRPDASTRVELTATINGEPLRVLVEGIQRERKFGESWLRVSGRGRAAFLAAPLAPVTQYTNDSAMTAQQALNATMTTNGVPIGWTLDWQIEDWQIPAGIWSHNGTWIDAAKRIAEAGGAYVQSHDTEQILRILPRYPTAPWNWLSATPDIALPEDVVEVEGIEWQEKPDYNAVWVHGGDQGRADRIIVGTSGGTKPAPTIVDSLATDPAMTRQRGLALLGDTGKQAQISLRLPVLPETGLIRPGKLIEYQEQGNTRRGLVRSLSISHNWPELWQTIGVETHE